MKHEVSCSKLHDVVLNILKLKRIVAQFWKHNFWKHIFWTRTVDHIFVKLLLVKSILRRMQWPSWTTFKCWDMISAGLDSILLRWDSAISVGLHLVWVQRPAWFCSCCRGNRCASCCPGDEQHKVHREENRLSCRQPELPPGHRGAAAVQIQ